MMKKIKAFTLIEMLVVVAIIALLIAILLPSLARARELARQTICGTNMKEIGTTFYIYQSDNLDEFPSVAHDTPPSQTAPIVRYIESLGGGQGAPLDPKRDEISLSRVQQDPGSTQISTTRSLWLLVRTGEVVPKQFLCPSADDSIDPTVDVTTYFDFIGYSAISYGYQIPYDNTNTCRPSADLDPRMAIAADRGPWSSSDPEQRGQWDGGNGPPGFFVDTVDPDVTPVLYGVLIDPLTDPQNDGLTEDSTPDRWKRFNSPNHGGQGQGAGQSVLYPDAHAQFNKTPLGGVDSDNIYTQMNSVQGWTGDDFRHALQWGAIPALTSTPIYPGDGSLSSNQTIDSLTDSLIWP